MGHASESEAEEIATLSRKAADGQLSPEEMFRLALRLFEPAHDPFAAIDLMKEVLQRDGSFDLARIWLAYLDVYEAMDDAALREAVALADEVSSVDDSLRAAALFVKGAALRQLDQPERSRDVLEASIQLADDWVANRLALADVYREMGRKGDAAQQYNAALANFERARLDARSEESLESGFFEMYFTGHGASDLLRDVIEEQLRSMNE